MASTLADLQKLTTPGRIAATMGLTWRKERPPSEWRIYQPEFAFICRYATAPIDSRTGPWERQCIEYAKGVLQKLQNNEHLSISGNAHIYNQTGIMIFGDFEITEIHPERQNDYDTSYNMDDASEDENSTIRIVRVRREQYPQIDFHIIHKKTTKCTVHHEEIDICLISGGNGKTIHIDCTDLATDVSVRGDGTGDGKIDGFTFTNTKQLRYLYFSRLMIEDFSNHIIPTLKGINFDLCDIGKMDGNTFNDDTYIKARRCNLKFLGTYTGPAITISKSVDDDEDDDEDEDSNEMEEDESDEDSNE